MTERARPVMALALEHTVLRDPPRFRLPTASLAIVEVVLEGPLKYRQAAPELQRGRQFPPEPPPKPSLTANIADARRRVKANRLVSDAE